MTTEQKAPSSDWERLASDCIRAWKGDPGIRAEFTDFNSYRAWREHTFARDNGISIEELEGQHVSADEYLAKARTPFPGGRQAVETLVTKWNASADLRSEFITFDIFAAFMRSRTQS